MLTNAKAIRISSNPNFRVRIFGATLKAMIKIVTPVSAQSSLKPGAHSIEVFSG